MSTPFLAEIRIFSFGFAPRGWVQCNGDFLPINQNQALFSLLGTTYGGNGQTTFRLPDLRGRIPINMGPGFTQGQVGGAQAHTLNISEIPQHTHTLMASTATATETIPNNTRVIADTRPNPIYGPASSLTSLAPPSITSIGGSQPHLNMAPFLTLMFCIAVQGIFPSQT